MPEIHDRDSRFVIIRPAEKALKNLSKQQPSPILAAMNTFADEWRKGTQVEVLKARYDYKPVSIGEQCRRQGHMFQIRMIRQQYRALLTFVETERVWYWLDVFVKNPTDQDNHIRTACDRALRLQERART